MTWYKTVEYHCRLDQQKCRYFYRYFNSLGILWATLHHTAISHYLFNLSFLTCLWMKYVTTVIISTLSKPMLKGFACRLLKRRVYSFIFLLDKYLQCTHSLELSISLLCETFNCWSIAQQSRILIRWPFFNIFSIQKAQKQIFALFGVGYQFLLLDVPQRGCGIADIVDSAQFTN